MSNTKSLPFLLLHILSRWASRIDLNHWKKKWRFRIYKAHNRLIRDQLKELEKIIKFYWKTYENITVICNFNAEISEHSLASVCIIYNFINIINKPTSYKNPDNPSCIELILTTFSKFIKFWEWIIRFS